MFNLSKEPPTQEEIEQQERELNTRIRSRVYRESAKFGGLVGLSLLALYIFSAIYKGINVDGHVVDYMKAIQGALAILAVGFISGMANVTDATWRRRKIEGYHDLQPLPETRGSLKKAYKLSRLHPEVDLYRQQVVGLGRPLYRGELSMMEKWHWDKVQKYQESKKGHSLEEIKAAVYGPDSLV